MGLFNLFWKRKSTKPVKKKRKKRNSPSTRRQNFERIKADVRNLRAQLGTINILLRKHDGDIAEHSIVIEKHIKQIEKLEQIVVEQPISSPRQQVGPISRPNSTVNPLQIASTTAQPQQQRLDIARLSEQEKRILSVFFQNQDIALSYADIAGSLNKSPNTIKNQMRQITLKADLFNYTIGNENRKRFKLRNGLKVEKYLNINRPNGRSDRPIRTLG